MAKPDPALLDAARYPFHCSIETRFGDLDVNQHINNVALVGILEEGRVRYHRAAGYYSAHAEAVPMVASMAVEFLGQSYFPDPIEVAVAALRLGRTSYTLCELVSQRERIVAYAEAVLVLMAKDGPVELPAEFRTGVQPWMLKP
jgi:acyl-CoA thioester hydrolase